MLLQSFITLLYTFEWGCTEGKQMDSNGHCEHLIFLHHGNIIYYLGMDRENRHNVLAYKENRLQLASFPFSVHPALAYACYLSNFSTNTEVPSFFSLSLFFC